MADSKLNIIINGVDKASGVFKGIGGMLQGIAKVAGGILLADVFKKAAGAAVGFVSDGMKMNAMLEETTLQFTTLMGSSDQAKAHVKELFKLGAETPFETEPILKASKALLTFGGAALNTKANLIMVGDAAAATGQNIDEVAFWTGRAYSMIQAGKPFGEAAMRLQEMGILSAEARDKMEAMQKAGASGAEVWAVMTQTMGKFNGAMKTQAGTWKGLTSTIMDNVKMAGATALKPFFDLIKEGMGWAAQFVQSADFTSWAEKAAGVFSNLIGVVKALIGGDSIGAWSNLAAGLSKVFGPEIIGKVFELKKAFEIISNSIALFPSDPLGAVANILYGFGQDNIADTLLGIADAVGNIISAFQSGSIPNILESLGLGNMVGPVMTIIAALQQFWGILVGVGQAVWSVLGPAFAQIVTAVQGVLPQLQPMFAALGQMFQTLAPIVGGILVFLLGVIVGLFNGIAAAIGPFLTMVIGFITNFANVISGIAIFIQNLFTLIYGLFTGNSQLIQTAWQGMVTGIITIFTSFWAMLVGLWNGLIMTVYALVSGFITGIVAFFTNLYQQLVGGSVIPDMIAAIILAFTTFITNAIAMFTTFIINLIALFVQMAADLIATVNGFVSNAAAAIRSGVSALYSAGKDLIEGLARGLQDALAAALSVVTDLVNKIVAKAKQGLQIGSPSKVFAQIGRNTMLGMAQGISQATPAAVAATGRAMSSVTNVTNHNEYKIFSKESPGQIMNALSLSGLLGGAE